MTHDLFRAGRRSCRLAAAALIWTASGCATAPVPPEPVVTYEQKLGWILQLEDQRILRVPEPPVADVQPARPRRRGVPPPAPAPTRDLTALVRDEDPRIRRRAALAIGRVKLSEGVAPLVSTLADTDPDVRAMAAFGLGLIADEQAAAALLPLLQDPEPLVRGRAAEALGRIGAADAAGAIGEMTAACARSAPVTAMAPDDETWPAAGEAEAEAFKLGLFALVRLRAWEPLAAAVLDGARPVTDWWPVAFALQRIRDERAAPALRQLLTSEGRYTRAFAARGLGEIGDKSAAPALLAILDAESGAGLELTIQTIRAVAQVGASEAVERLIQIGADPRQHPNLRLEAITALGTLRAREATPLVQDLLTDEWPAMRSAALRALAAIDPESIVFVMASLEPDRDWRVRAAMAGVLAEVPEEIALPRLRAMLNDEDRRVRPAVLDTLVRFTPPDLAAILFAQLKDPDFVVRATAARHLGDLAPEGAADALRQAYQDAIPDSAYEARAAALSALAELGAEAALDTLRAALSDKDWAVRLHAQELLARFDAAEGAAAAIRPVPNTPPVPYDDPALAAPVLSPRVFIETAHGTIEFELAVLDAPQTSRNFIELAARGYFNGLPVHRVVGNFVVQDGDPRGDGHGGPGYTIRDELNERPFLRGTVGMARSWSDTNGSQFFITHSPQPHLDGLYTAFGHVVQGMEVVDRIRVGDVIERVRVWDGTKWTPER